MPPVRLALPRLNTWSRHGQVQSFLAALAPHWDGFYDVSLDLSACTFLSAEGAAFLTAFKLQRDQDGFSTTDIDWATVPADVAMQLGRWRVSPLFGRPAPPWTGNAIPLLHQTELDPGRLDEYICSQVCVAGNMPAMTRELADEVQRALIEMFQNVFLHTGSFIGGIAVGQLYPRAKAVQVCVCDAGMGMVEQIRRAGRAQGTAADTLEWALGPGNTTRVPENGPPGGLGLFMLREFVKINGGSLRVVANDGYLCQEGGAVVRGGIAASFPGTLLQIKFNVRDDVVYDFAPE